MRWQRGAKVNGRLATIAHPHMKRATSGELTLVDVVSGVITSSARLPAGASLVACMHEGRLTWSDAAIACSGDGGWMLLVVLCVLSLVLGGAEAGNHAGDGSFMLQMAIGRP